MIRIREVRVIDDENQQLGVMPTFKALALAQEKGLDLVEVAPTAVPPVCRILDYGQYKYEIQKRDREAKKKQKSQTFKEIRRYRHAFLLFIAIPRVERCARRGGCSR